ncbi:MAG: hypothetical protein Q4G05_00765 [Clostridia bacterium]|nr:hypothetical protein [Clostridia bacterium]
MKAIVNLYSEDYNEIEKFLENFYEKQYTQNKNSKSAKWEKTFDNPIELADIIGVFIDNNDKYKINMWVSIDKGTFINVSEYNANSIIKYLYERFPY